MQLGDDLCADAVRLPPAASAVRLRRLRVPLLQRIWLPCAHNPGASDLYLQRHPPGGEPAWPDVPSLACPCGHPPLEKPARLLRAALWAQEERPCRLAAEERLWRCARSVADFTALGHSELHR